MKDAGLLIFSLSGGGRHSNIEKIVLANELHSGFSATDCSRSTMISECF